MKIVADADIPFIESYFPEPIELHLKPGRAISAADVATADILLVRSVTPVNPSLLEHSNVRFVGSVTAGADHLDTVWLEQAGIEWCTAAGFNAPPVADYVISTIAALQRKQLLPFHPRVAVIGVGHVGQLVATRLQALPAQVILTDPYRANEVGFTNTALTDISDVDLITFHVPLTKTGAYPTYHFIDRAFLKCQKPGCVLVNTSRGSIIRTEELILHGTHLTWCLDVWEHEPTPNQTLLERALIATPHIAGYSIQSKHRGIDIIYQTLCQKGLLSSSAPAAPAMPTQTLTYAGANHHWQDIVLGVFNPLIMTAMLRHTFHSSPNHAQAFDTLRQQFNYRHEFASTNIIAADLAGNDLQFLQRLGFKVLE